MSEPQATAARGGRGIKTNKSQSRSTRAGIQFPVGRVHRILRRNRYASRIGDTAPVYLAAVLQYLTEEVIGGAREALKNDKRRVRLIPRDIRLSLYNDEELNALVKGITIAGGGVPQSPDVRKSLLKRASSPEF